MMRSTKEHFFKKSLQIRKAINFYKDRQYNGQKNKDKSKNNDLENTTKKTRLSNMNLTKTGDEFRCSGL